MSELAEAELKVAEKELNKTLSWALNKKLQHRYQELFKRLDLQDQVVAAHSRNPGFEVVELLERLYDKRGRNGLHEFYELLQELEEQASLDLIDNNKVAVILFLPNDAILPQPTTQPIQFVDVPIVPTHHVPQSKNNNNSNLLQHDAINTPRNTEYFMFTTRRAVLIDPTEQLDAIHELLRENKIVAIHGLSGFGKSTLANEYGYRVGSDYDLVVWIDCRDQENIARSFVTLAELLNIGVPNKDNEQPPLLEDLKLKAYVLKVKQQLQQKKSLIVYDNCNDWDIMRIIYEHFYPAGMKVRAIITTQRPPSEWNYSEIPVGSCPVKQYGEEATVEYMLKIAHPKCNSTPEEQQCAQAIYSIYNGTPIFISLISSYIHQYKITFDTYWKKLNVLISIALDIKKIPLLMAIEGIIDESKFLMQALAILGRITLATVCEMNYLVQCKSKTKESDIKSRFSNLIDMGLIKVDSTSISIGHDIIQKYILSTMTDINSQDKTAIETVVEKWLEEVPFSYYLPNLLEFYFDRCEHSTAMETLVEIAGIWTNIWIAKKVVHHIAREEDVDLVQLINGIEGLSPDSRASLLQVFYSLRNQFGSDHIIVMIAELCLAKHANHDLSSLYQRTKALKNASAKCLKLYVEVQLENGKQLLKTGNVYAAREELKQCYKTASQSFPGHTNTILRAYNYLLYSTSLLDPLEAIPLAAEMLREKAPGQIEIENQALTKLKYQAIALPQLLSKASYASQTTLKSIVKDRADAVTASAGYNHYFYNTKPIHDMQEDFQTFAQVDIGPYAVLSKIGSGCIQPFIAIVEAIELNFSLCAIRPEILLKTATIISHSTSWNKASNLQQNLNLPYDYSETINTALPPEKVGNDAYKFFRMMVQFAYAGMTVQQFLDKLKSLSLPDDKVEEIYQRLKNTTIPVEFMDGEWQNVPWL
jgi:DNA replication protein DnaC